MQSELETLISKIVPEVFWKIIDHGAVEQYLTGDLGDVQIRECASTLTLEKKAKTKNVQPSKCEAPTINEVLPAFLTKLKKLDLASDSSRILILFRAEKNISFSEFRQIEQQISDIANAVPLIFVDPSMGQREASIQCLATTGQAQRGGARLAYDLDETLSRWPEQFTEISWKTKASGGFNLVISTRHEPSISSCFQKTYTLEQQVIKSIGVQTDMLAHAWLDFNLWEKLFPFFDMYHWFDRCMLTKAFYCRLYRMDAYYDDQKRNIERLEELAPDISVIHVSNEIPPEMPDNDVVI